MIKLHEQQIQNHNKYVHVYQIQHFYLTLLLTSINKLTNRPMYDQCLDYLSDHVSNL